MIKDEIEAIAFDIDGTLYPAWKLNILILPYFIKNLFFFIKYAKVRKILHRTAPLADFYEYQARLLADYLAISVEQAHQKMHTLVYNGLARFFPHIKPYAHIQETFKLCKEAGFKLAILSDFPPEQKGTIWGVKDFCDVVLGSESCGALKPSLYAFGLLSRALNVPAHKILYVGNSVKLDVLGAKNAGMKTAYIMPFWRKILHCTLKEADFSFKNYRHFQKIVLQ